jgi:CRP-like cAMP-binding protein
MPANDDNPLDVLVGKLNRLRALQAPDEAALRSLPISIEQVPADRQLVREGERPTKCCVLLRGYAYRYKVTGEGARQIVSFHMAGDILDVQHLMLERADHSVVTNTEASVAWVSAQDIREILAAHPAINEALWCDALIDASIFREWVLNVGRRDAKARIAHMLCEFAARRDAAGLGSPEQFELPMTQEEIGDATGLTFIHVARMFHALEEEGVIARDNRRFQIIDWQRLKRVADFDSAYLHAAA